MNQPLFISRFEYCLKNKDLSYEDFCRKLSNYGIYKNKSSISSYIAGRYLPKQDFISAAADIFDVSESWLLGYDDKDLSLSPEEMNLVLCWRKATEDEKESVAFALRKHNFSFDVKKEKIS